jgi:DNA repair exonuclease SbcCD ATPase subunit
MTTMMISNILERYTKLDKSVQRVHDEHNTTVRELNQIEKQHGICLSEYEDLVMTGEYVQKLITLLTQQDLQPIEALLTQGLNTVFPERNYTVHIEVADRGKDKTAEFIVTEIKGDQTIVTPAKEHGFGVQTILSLILQVYYILFFKGRHFVCVDEAFTQVYEDNLDGMFDFIRYLIDDLGFDFMGITHDTRLWEFGDKIYRVRDGSLVKESK